MPMIITLVLIVHKEPQNDTCIFPSAGYHLICKETCFPLNMCFYISKQNTVVQLYTFYTEQYDGEKLVPASDKKWSNFPMISVPI